MLHSDNPRLLSIYLNICACIYIYIHIRIYLQDNRQRHETKQRGPAAITAHQDCGRRFPWESSNILQFSTCNICLFRCRSRRCWPEGSEVEPFPRLIFIEREGGGAPSRNELCTVFSVRGVFSPRLGHLALALALAPLAGALAPEPPYCNPGGMRISRGYPNRLVIGRDY